MLIHSLILNASKRKIFPVLLLLVCLSLLLTGCNKSDGDKTVKSSQKEISKFEWDKRISEDKFANTKYEYATLRSVNEPKVDVFANPVYAYLNLFKPVAKEKNFASIRFKESSHPIVFETNGYTECSVGPCVVKVKFDDGKILEYEFYRNVSSAPLNIIYCCLSGGRSDFVSQAMKAHKIEIRVNFYQRGYGDFTFTPNSQLDWN